MANLYLPLLSVTTRSTGTRLRGGLNCSTRLARCGGVEAADLMGVSVDTLRRWERAGRITAVRTPTGHRRFKRSDVEALLRG
jgi:excisionase family DNA binding protein